MPDITMCLGIDCPIKETCYRYKAKPYEYQSYFVDAPIKDNKCEHYWEVTSKVIKKIQKQLIIEIMKADEEDGLYE